MFFKHILCVSNYSLISRNAEYASLALAHHFGAKLTVLSCGDYYTHDPNIYFDENIIQPLDDPLYQSDYLKHLEQKKREAMDHFAKIQSELNISLSNEISHIIKLENEVTATLNLLDENKNVYDLIVVGKQNNSHWERLLFGSPAKEIFDETRIPTLFMPSGENWKCWSPAGILVCSSLHGDDINEELIGANIASKFSAKLTIIHAIEDGSASSNFPYIVPLDFIPIQKSSDVSHHCENEIYNKLEIIEKKLRQATNLMTIEKHVAAGQVTQVVMDYLKSDVKNNLLIIGSRGENALKRFFLGCTTDVLEEACQIPILVVYYPNL